MIFSIGFRTLFPWLVVLALSGCAAGGLTIPITDPQPTKILYRGQPQSANMELRYEDARPDTNKTAFSNWIVPMRFEFNAKPLDPAAFIADNTTRELISRGLPIRQSASANALPIRILMMGIENHRLSGFSPMVTLTSLIAETDTPAGKKRISIFIKRGKVPVWSFDELNEPCYNEPMNLLTKELAAKINREIYGLQISDADVDHLFRKIAAEASTNPLSYFDVYQLGFGNNPKAIPGLIQLSSSPHEYIRLAAISSLGTLKASDHLPLLISLYRGIDAQIWQNRAIALKSIGDLDTKESRQFILDEFELLKTRSDKGSVWMRKVLALYLNQDTTPQVVQTVTRPPVATPQAVQPAPQPLIAAPPAKLTTPASPQTSTSPTPASIVSPQPNAPQTAATTSSPAKLLPSLPAERLLTGSELKNHFSTPDKVIATTNGAHTLTLDFQKRGGLYIILTHPAAANPLTNSASGEYSVKENQNQICLQGHSSNKILKALWDCYSVYALDNNTYALRAMDGTSMTYQRGSPSPPNIQQALKAEPPQVNLAIPKITSTPSPATMLPAATQAQSLAPSQTTLPLVNGGERQLTGEALRNHFSIPGKITAKTKTGQMISLDFRPRNTLHLALLNRSLSNVHSNAAVGDYTVKEAQNQVCLGVRVPNLELRALWDCFSVYAFENNSFEMRSRDGTTLSYQRGESTLQSVKQAPNAATPQANSVIPPPTATPSPAALLPVTEPLAQSTSPSQTTLPPVNGGERQLTGETLRNHFATPMKVRTKTKSGHTIDLDFRARSTLYLSQINRGSANYQPHTAVGDYAVKEARNQVCLSFISQNFDLKPLSDCFSVYALENSTFEMRARDGTTLSYQRATAGFQAEPRLVTQQAPDTLPSPQTYSVIQPSAGSIQSPVGAGTAPGYATEPHAGTTPQVTTSERRLTGVELTNHFSVPAKVSAKTNGASKLIIDFRANRSIYITNPNPPANYPHTNTASGDYSFRESENLVCFRVNSLNLTLRALWDCFAVYELENNMFQLRARDGTTVSYQRNV